LVEDDTARIDVADHLADLLDGKHPAEMRVTHAGAGRVGHLRRLQVEASLVESAERAGVIEVEMGDDDLLHGPGVDPERRESRSGRSQYRPLAPPALRLVEAGVDNDRAVWIANYPDEVVE